MMPQQLINLEQIRAKNALDIAKSWKKSNNQVAGYYSFILNNGLLSTLAFSIQKKEEMEQVAEAITYHIRNMIKKNLLPCTFSCQSSITFIDELSNGTGLQLRLIANESMAFLSYLKRFNSLLPKP